MMRARFTFKPNPAGLRKLVEGPQMAAFVDRKTSAIANGVRRLAPYYSGAFRRTIRALAARRMAGRGWVGRVTTSDPFWHLEEFGSVNNPPHRTFGRAVTAAGAKFRDRR